MRILGGHDYYDGALAYGRDESLVFVRTPEEKAEVLPYEKCGLTAETRSFAFERERHERFRAQEEMQRNKILYQVHPATIWFAGRRYGGARVRSSAGNGGEVDCRWYWTEEKFRAFLDGAEIRMAPPSRWRRDEQIDAAGLALHFQREPSAAETEWLIGNRVSVAVWRTALNASNAYCWYRQTGWKIDVDGLGAMGFASRLDPYTAFQELSQWVGGVLPRNSNPMVRLSEDDALRKHGMDEWSFRKPPGS